MPGVRIFGKRGTRPIFGVFVEGWDSSALISTAQFLSSRLGKSMTKYCGFPVRRPTLAESQLLIDEAEKIEDDGEAAHILDLKSCRYPYLVACKICGKRRVHAALALGGADARGA